MRESLKRNQKRKATPLMTDWVILGAILVVVLILFIAGIGAALDD